MADSTNAKRVAVDRDGDLWDEIEPDLFKSRCGHGHQCDLLGECHGDELLLAELAHGYGLRSLTAAPSPVVALVDLIGHHQRRGNAECSCGQRFDLGFYPSHLADVLISAGVVAQPPLVATDPAERAQFDLFIGGPKSGQIERVEPVRDLAEFHALSLTEDEARQFDADVVSARSPDTAALLIDRVRAAGLDSLADRLQQEWDNGFRVAAVTWSELRALADLPSLAVDLAERDLPYYEDVRDLLDAMLGSRRAEEVADMLTDAILLARRPAVDREALAQFLYEHRAELRTAGEPDHWHTLADLLIAEIDRLHRVAGQP